MRVRLVAAVAAVAALLSVVGPVAPASAADVGTASLETLSLYSGRWTRSASDYGLAVAQAGPDYVALGTDSTYPSTWYIRLAGGALPQSGTTYTLGSASTANKITGQCSAPGPGLLTVDSVAYDASTVTSMAASYAFRCLTNDAEWVMGTIRIGSTAPASVVRPAPVNAPLTGLGTPSALSVSFANTGTAPTGVLGAAALDTTLAGAADFSVTRDGCVGVTLAPGDSCTVDLSFTRSVAGSSGARLTIPDSSAPGGLVMAGVIGTAVDAPQPPAEVRTFPVSGGIGVAWTRASSGWAATAYHVQRLAADGTWADVSGQLSDTTFTWVDQTAQPGDAAQYRVLGENADGLGQPSAVASGARPTTDPQVGTSDVVTADQDPGGQPLPSWVSDHFSTVVTSNEPGVSGSAIFDRSLAIAGMTFSMPSVLPGPGTYHVDDASNAPDLGSTIQAYANPTCSAPTGELNVAEVLYTANRELETFAGTYRLDCPDGTSSYGEIRWHSTLPFNDLEVTPSRPDAGRVPVGQTSAPLQLTLTNRGTTSETLGLRTITGAAAGDWQIASDACPDVLSAGATCTVDVQGVPTASGIRAATLQFTDSTARGMHRAALSMTGTSVPSAPTNVKALRLPGGGVDLSWDLPADTGGTGMQRFVVHRVSAGAETRVELPVDVAPSWVDAGAPADATYAVSAVNEIGEGVASSALSPTPVEEPMFVSASENNQSPKLDVVAQPGGTRLVPWAAVGDPTSSALGVALSPDGRTLLSTQSGANGWNVWREPVDRSSAPVKLWTSPISLGRVRWSPDGTRIAVVSSGAATVTVLNATTGAQLLSIPNLDEPDWLPDSRTLVGPDVSAQGEPLVRVDAVTGQRLGQLTGTLGATHPSVSPDGRWIAFSRGAYPTAAAGTFLVPVSGGAARQITTSQAVDLAWQPSSHVLAMAPLSPYQWSFFLVSVQDDGTTGQPQQVSLREYPEIYLMAWGGARVSIAPSAAITGAAATFGVNTSALPAGTTFTCAVDSRTPAPCGATYSASALTTGAHTLRVWSASPNGRVTVATRTFSTDATPPAPRLTAPTVAVTTGATATVTYTATDTSGVSSYDVRYRRASWSGTFGSYALWLAGTRYTSATLTLPVGYRYCFSVRARDVYGNVSAWTAERCIARPLDDRSLAAATTGWTRSTNTAFYLSTATDSTRAGAALTLANVGALQVVLVATTCSTCGSVAVYVGAAKVGSASLYATRTTNRVLITLPVTAMHVGTLRIVVTSPSGRLVRIDGVALRST